MHTYELMVITRGSLDEAAVTQTIERFTGLIQQQGGSVERVDHWGRRQFAYEIDHMTEGSYTVVDLRITPDGAKELERQLRLADEVVRHKLLRPDLRRKKVKKARTASS